MSNESEEIIKWRSLSSQVTTFTLFNLLLWSFSIHQLRDWISLEDMASTKKLGRALTLFAVLLYNISVDRKVRRISDCYSRHNPVLGLRLKNETLNSLRFKYHPVLWLDRKINS